MKDGVKLLEAGGDSKPHDGCTPVHVWGRESRASRARRTVVLGADRPDRRNVVSADRSLLALLFPLARG